MGLAGIVFSMISVAVGAILYWAVTVHSHGFRLSTVGVILMVLGVVGFVFSTYIFATSRQPSVGRNRLIDRQRIDTRGRTNALHDELS
jgi:hypothetical protein